MSTGRTIRYAVLLSASATVIAGLSTTAVVGQRGGVFRASRDHPAIEYSAGPVRNVVSELNQNILDGAVRLEFNGRSGYLRSVLDALDIPIESQVAVYSKTSRQAEMITSENPRVVFFNDTASVGWVRDTDLLEVAAQDQQQGVVFYTLSLTQAETPQFTRDNQCLACHLSWDTLGVPGLQVLSTAPLSADPNAYATGFVSDHRSRLEDRWGGWYVTGSHGSVAHMGNVEVTDVEDPQMTFGVVPPELGSLEGKFNLDGYPSAHSDIAALLVLNHQAHMTNLITRVGWEARRILFRNGGPSPDDSMFHEVILDAAEELVDYLLFVDEAPLPTGIKGSSRFTERFSSGGPHDSQGRSLRELDLARRLMRYPCSYMLYTPAFDALPAIATDAIYARMWEILSGEVQADRYVRLSLADRQSIVDILRDTKTNLPSYFQSVTR